MSEPSSSYANIPRASTLDEVDSLPSSSAGSDTSMSPSEEEELSDAEREWRESLQQLELLLTMVLVPYLGKRYPAGDIPPQARRLYTLTTLRMIVDIGYDAVPLLGEPGAAPLDIVRMGRGPRSAREPARRPTRPRSPPGEARARGMAAGGPR